jgi:OmcA/MtrC family decaheme c-type cytochrome
MRALNRSSLSPLLLIGLAAAGMGVLLFGTRVIAEQDPAGLVVLPASHELDSYVDPLLVDFVRPGLSVKLENPNVSIDRRLSVDIRIADNKGLPLDRDGVFSPGPVSLSFIAARLPSTDATYVAYTTRNQTSVLTGLTATQASSDSGGTYTQLSDGLYRYRFGVALPEAYPSGETHAIGVYASRNLTEFDLDTQFSNDVIEFVPDGGPVAASRDRVSTAACNSCHDPLAVHGGARQEVQLCTLCHTEQTSDPDTGNTVDFKVMIHKIHSGRDLPSVRAGTPYQIIGFGGSVHDYSEVVFPDTTLRCEQCHQGASQSLDYLTRPSRAACGSCHDDVSFATGENHAPGPALDDTRCSACHIPVGDLEFDVSVAGAHTIPTEAASLPGVVFDILNVENGTPGNRPTVVFSIADKAGSSVDIEDMSRVALVLAGPASDYAGYVSENAIGATGANGLYSFTFSQTISADFTGTMAVGIEGYRDRSLLRSSGDLLTVRDAGLNDVFYFDTGGGDPTPRRRVVAIENCNSCHGALSAHGGSRNDTEQCVLCHTSSETDMNRRPPDRGEPESVHFKTMIHKIHTGEDLTDEFTVFGFGGSEHNFTEVRFPGDRRNCGACHVEGTEQLPTPAPALPSLSPRGLVSLLQPASAACLSCHTSRDALVHAVLQTNALGESCSVCHGPNRQFAVDRVHTR